MTKAGRPTKYDPVFCEQIIELMRAGYSILEVAYQLEVHKDTIYEWEKVHSEFSDALKKARDYSEGWWLLQGRNNLNNKEFNSTLWYMNMKNRHKWSDKVDNTHTVINHEDALKALE
jgi:transposase